MFYDERIELERGKISRNCIIISVIVALFLGIPRFIYLNEYIITEYANSSVYSTAQKFYLILATEFTVIFSGAVCLLIGFFYKLFEKDGEFRKAKKSKFYNKAGKIHLILSLAGFALACAAFQNIGTFDISISEIAFSFIMSLFAYCAYAFKKSEIYFNYSIMEDENYYIKVVWNIVKLAICTFGLMIISFISNIFIDMTGGSRNGMEVMGQLASMYFSAFTLIALAYFVYSYLEKTSYDNESALLSNSPFITLAVAAAVSVFLVLYCIKMLLTPSPQGSGGIIGILHHMCDVCIIAFLTYLNYEYQRERKSRLIGAGTGIILSTIPAFQCISAFLVIHLNSFSRLIMSHHNNEDAREMYRVYYEKTYDAMNLCKDITAALQLIAVILIFRSLIKRKHIPDSHYFIIIFSIAVCAADLCLRPYFSGTLQGEYVLALFRNSVFTAILLYSSVITLGIKKKKASEERTSYENK